ncbi:MAG: glycosyltransferase [Actinomadura sp.]
MSSPSAVITGKEPENARRPAHYRAQHPCLLRRRTHHRHRGHDHAASGAQVTAHTVTVIVPAYNEEEGLPATLESLLRQTVPAQEIIVVDDHSTDRTGAVARAYGVTVLRPPRNLGSKARAQNHALPHCTTDLVLAVDADTVIAPDYIEKIEPVFADPEVVVAAGNVQTRFTRTVWERGRSIEYLFGFHWHRPIQNRAGSPTVCSGCCSAFRRTTLVAAGGFPERTIVEDMDYCVPVDHEILTRNGWKTYDELIIGEDVLALDHDHGVLEWLPLEDVAVFDYDGDLYVFERKGGWSVAFTPNHRWPVITSTGKRKILPANEMQLDDGRNHGYRIPLTGTYESAGSMSPRLAAIVGWLVADGHIQWHSANSCQMNIAQLPGERLDEIIGLTGTSAGRPKSNGVQIVPISRQDRDEILRYMRTKADFPRVVGQLSTEAAEAMFDAFVKGDGCVNHRGELSIGQSPTANAAVRDGIQMLALMVGRNSFARPHSVAMHIRPVGKTIAANKGVTRRHHRGKIWCPKTKHGTWVARHNGAVIPTGNTWSQQIAGHKAVYVGDAVAWAADPENLTYLRKQVWRWMAGFCQNIRLHMWEVIARKPMLALWIALAVAEILTAPLWWATPFVLTLAMDQPAGRTAAVWFGAEFGMTMPPLIYAARRRRLPVLRVLLNLPCVYLTKIVNIYYAWKALIVELVLVPLRLSQGLVVYEKGRAHTPGAKPGVGRA